MQNYLYILSKPCNSNIFFLIFFLLMLSKNVFLHYLSGYG